MQISTKQTLVLYEQLPLLARPGPTTALLILSSCIFTYIFIFPLTSISKPAHEKAPPLSGLSRFISINGKILHDLLHSPPRNPVLERVTPEITLCIMKNLPTFSALNALIRASKPCHDIWLENEYGISEAIAMNQFGEFWAEAMKLLRLQAKLKHASGTHEGGMRVFGKKIEEGKLGRGIKPVISKVGMGLVLRGQGEMAVKRLPPAGSLDGMGILNGRVKIGKEEAAQLLCYKRKVADTRNVFIKTVLRARSYGTAPRLLRFVTSRPPADVVHRIDRAIYNYWLVLLACTPDFITCLATFEYHNLNDSLSTFMDSQDALSDEEWEASIDREYKNVKDYLDFEGRKRELEELCEVTYFTHCLVELPGPGGGHYFEEWGKEEDEGLQGWAGNQIRRAAREGGVDPGGYRIAG